MLTYSQPWILITGNGAFGDTAVRKEFEYVENPSSKVALSLHGEEIAGYKIHSESLDWDRHPEEILEPLLSTDTPPEAVISLGVFSRRATITVERIAANVQDFQFAESDGYRPPGLPVFEKAPAAYFSTLPIKAITHRMRDAGIPALISNTASTHGCNSVMYTALHLIEKKGLLTKAGFIHLPDPPEHVAKFASNGPSMSLDLQIQAIREAVKAIAENKEGDLQVPVGEWEW